MMDLFAATLESTQESPLRRMRQWWLEIVGLSSRIALSALRPMAISPCSMGYSRPLKSPDMPMSLAMGRYSVLL